MGIAAMDILCCRITIGDADPSNPMRIQNGVEITEVQSLEINESYKKLIGTAKVIFPKGSVCRSTIIGNVTLEGKDVSRITTEVMQDGVIIEKRSAQRLVDETTFKVGQRINIKLGYNGVLKNMFDGYITGYNSDSTLEIQCENMAYKLKLKQAPHFETPAKGTTVNEVLEGKYNILKDTGFRIHSDTKRFEILDYVGHRDVHVLLPQKGRYTADPPGAVIFRMMPQVMIPSRRVYAGPVTAAEGEPVIRPRNPRAFRLYLREPFQQLVVILHLRHILQCRDMPCPADYGYAPERFLLGRSYHATHPRFTDKVPAGGMFREGFPERGHSFLDGLEDAAAVSALFYVHVPPRFTVSIAGSFCQQVKRITRLFNSFIIRFYRLVAILPFRFEGKGMGKREIEEA